MVCSLADLANVATIAGAIVAVGALFYTAYQVKQHTKVSRGQFWLELEKMFSAHDEIHFKIRPGGEWSKSTQGPKSIEEWAKVEDYMGLFEHCETMIQDNLIDLGTFKDIFGYRLKNLLENDLIVHAKLVKERDYWNRFINLINRLNIPIDLKNK